MNFKKMSVLALVSVAAHAHGFRPLVARASPLLRSAQAMSLSSNRRNTELSLARTLGAWNPLTPFDTFNSMFNDLDFPTTSLVSGLPHRMLMDVKETPTAYEIIVDLPGVDSKDIDIKLRRHDLVITAHRETSKKEDKEQFHRIERRSGSISRMVTLPENVNLDSMEAVNKNGVLHVTIKKLDVPKVEEKKIEVKDAQQ